MEQDLTLATEKLVSLKQTAQRENLLDVKAFDTLIEETGADVVYDILRAFKGTLNECLGRLEQGNKLSSEDTYKVCHKLKGSALLIGFKPLGEACMKAMVPLKKADGTYSQEIHNTTSEVIRLLKSTQDIVFRFVS